MSRIIPRSAWGARPPRSVSRTAWLGVTLWVHHSTGSAPANNPVAEQTWMRNIQAFHMGPARGWADFGYGFAIAPSGRIYEGRGANVWAAHCPGRNNEPSVCIMGDYSRTRPTEAAREAVWWLADRYGLTRLAGHREGFPTSCPGDALMAALVKAPRPVQRVLTPAPERPYGNTLRVVLNGRYWAGWHDAEGPLRWIARYGIKPGAEAAIAWRGSVWRGPEKVTNVAATLVNRHL